ncbi:MAG: 3'-5' exonuclease, partial [Ilumatobacteraceae bacterium]
MVLPRFAVVDVETSGLSTRRHRILQIGVVTVEPDGAIGDEWSSLVGLRWPWSRVGPRRVHGISRRMLRGAPRPDVALTELQHRLDGAVFTAHNADFDAEFIVRAAHRAGTPIDLDRRLCTMRLSRWLDPDRALTHGLADVCARYDVTIERHHDALCDARAAAAVLPHLLAAGGITDSVELDALLVSGRVPRRGRPRIAGADPALMPP